RQRFLELRCGNGEAEVKALHFPAAVLLQEVELRLGLHSLCNDAKVEALRQLDHRADDGRVFESIGQILDKVPVDLQTVNRETLQVAQRRMPHAEVVDGDGNACSSQALEHFERQVDVLHGHGLGNLQLETTGLELRLHDCRLDAVHQR